MASSISTPLLDDENGVMAKTEDEDQHNTVVDQVGNTSFFKTCFNLVNAISGIGIVSLPFTLASGGWLSLSLLLIIAIACCYTGILVKKCMDMGLNIKSYPDIGQHAFGDKGRILVSIIMNIELYLAVTGYLILEGDNLNKLVPNVQINLGGLTIGGTTIFTIVSALVILPTVLLEDLSLLSYVSVGGVLASSIFIVSLVWNATIDGTGFHGKGTLIRWSGIPFAISFYAYCYSANPILPILYNSMRNKTHFSSVLVVCFIVCTIGHAAAAILGYLMFGDEVDSQVTLNLQSGKLSSKVAIYITLVSPITKYALMLSPVINAIKAKLPCHYNLRLTHMLVSTSLLVSSFIIAVAIPLFGYLMSLVGALLSITASILIPSVCYLKISGAYRRFGSEMIINFVVIVMGAIFAVLGTFSSLVDIIQNL